MNLKIGFLLSTCLLLGPIANACEVSFSGAAIVTGKPLDLLQILNSDAKCGNFQLRQIRVKVAGEGDARILVNHDPVNVSQTFLGSTGIAERSFFPYAGDTVFGTVGVDGSIKQLELESLGGALEVVHVTFIGY